MVIELLMGVLAVVVIITTEMVFVALVALEEDIVAAVEATADTMVSSLTHSYKTDKIVGEDSISATAQELNTSM